MTKIHSAAPIGRLARAFALALALALNCALSVSCALPSDGGPAAPPRLTSDFPDAVEIVFSGSLGECQSADVKLSDGGCEITDGGVYSLSGTFYGQITVSARSDEEVTLVLNGLTAVSPSAALWVENSAGVTIILADGTDNRLSDSAVYADDRANACVCSRDDLTIGGTGALTVSASFNNGIDSSDTLRIIGGDITVTAPNNALKGNEAVTITGGTLRITSGDDGIKTGSDKDASAGVFTMTGGEATISAADDGVQAAVSVTVTAGRLSVAAGGKTLNCDRCDVADGCLTTG